MFDTPHVTTTDCHNDPSYVVTTCDVIAQTRGDFHMTVLWLYLCHLQVATCLFAITSWHCRTATLPWKSLTAAQLIMTLPLTDHDLVGTATPGNSAVYSDFFYAYQKFKNCDSKIKCTIYFLNPKLIKIKILQFQKNFFNKNSLQN